MSIWLFVALMTAAATLAALWPLLRKPDKNVPVGGNDLAVYRDQLQEIERDCETGLIGASEAQAARVELSRRLIAAADAAGPREPAQDRKPKGKAARIAAEARRAAEPQRRRLAAAVTLLVLPIGAAGLYLALGSPGLPDQPLAGRIAVAAPNSGEAAAEALARVEAHLEQNPEDGRGWEVIAPVYMRLGRYDDAVRARGNALRLLGATAARQADFGEALVAAANGVVTTEAKAAFDAAIRMDPADVSARYYQGLAAEQDGNQAEAARLWRRLLADAPEAAAWAAAVKRALSRVDPSAAQATSGAKDAAPGADAASGQDVMIRAMVERLAERLQQDGSDVEGWVRLVRAYTVLKDADHARAAVAHARAALASDPDKIRRLDEGLTAIAQDAAAPILKPANGATPEASPSHDPRSMVERLAARLRQDGANLDGWAMLVRSYKALGEPERARAAAADARRALASNAEQLRRLEVMLKGLGLD
jgi:cytochrome c-type biogenesis protein CcmH